jgi:holo-[acyl-carrier protein] synthase
MIVGIGVDRLVIARIERSLHRYGDRFIQRIYSEAEIEQSQARGNPARRFGSQRGGFQGAGNGFQARCGSLPY